MIKKIISIHIPKTAGTTFKTYLEASYKNDIAVISTKPVFSRCDKLNISKSTIDIDTYNEYIIHGHFTLNELLYDNDFFYITWLRDPVERVISHYYYWKHKPDDNIHPIENKIKNEELSLEDFAKIPCMRNLQLHFLGNDGVNKINFIGITELFDTSIKLLEKKLKKKIIASNIKNQLINPKKEFVTQKTKDKIKNLNIEEYTVYNTVLNKIKG
jgi:hypothetical protein